ncbi:MAG: zinc-binding alcohol dehydrogenase [Bacteroidales bacterium]|nr:zinc-binding alcohol dehydrogenase [Bacteroidales bacterium]
MKTYRVWVPEKNKAELSEFDFDEKIENPHEIILKNLFSHVSAGTELACLAGTESFFTIPGVPGYTAVAEIIKKGDLVPFQVGDIVYTYGPHAGYFKINITDRWHGVCVKVPDGLAPDVASFTHMAGIAMTAIRVSDIELGDKVAVTGLGAIGILAGQLARLQGAMVLGTDPEEFRRKLALECGIDVVINPLKMNPVEEVRRITGGEGVTTLIEASGNPAALQSMLDAAALNGEVILLGSPRNPYETNLTETLRHFHLLPWNHSLKGALEFIFPTQPIPFAKHSIERNAGIIMNLMKEGKLNIDPIYTHRLSPFHAAKAYEGLRNKKDEFVGVVFDWSQV